MVLTRMPNFFDDYYYSEFNNGSCVKVLYMKFATKIAYVQDKISPKPQKLYTGMPVMPVTNSRVPGIRDQGSCMVRDYGKLVNENLEFYTGNLKPGTENWELKSGNSELNKGL